MEAKPTLYYYLFVFIVTALFMSSFKGFVNTAAAQNNPEFYEKKTNEELDNKIKSFSAKYFVEKVYLKILINGITENTFYGVERSVDGQHFESIGYIKCAGTNANANLLYCFTDDTPLKIKAYYRIKNMSDAYGLILSSETKSVIPQFTNTETANNNTLQANTVK